MQLRLEVDCSWDEDVRIEQTLTNFDEQEKIAVQVGRAVRDWLRRIPVRRQGDRQHIYLNAAWVEGAERLPRKSKKTKKAAEEDSDGRRV